MYVFVNQLNPNIFNNRLKIPATDQLTAVMCLLDSKCCWKVFPDRLDNFDPQMVQIKKLGSSMLILKTSAILMKFGTYKLDFLNELIFQFSLEYLDSDVLLTDSKKILWIGFNLLWFDIFFSMSFLNTLKFPFPV